MLLPQLTALSILFIVHYSTIFAANLCVGWLTHYLLISFLYCCTSSIPMNSSINLFSLSSISANSKPGCLFFLMLFTKVITYLASFCLSLPYLLSPISTTLLSSIPTYFPIHSPPIFTLLLSLATTSMEFIVISQLSRMVYKYTSIIG